MLSATMVRGQKVLTPYQGAFGRCVFVRVCIICVPNVCVECARGVFVYVHASHVPMCCSEGQYGTKIFVESHTRECIHVLPNWNNDKISEQIESVSGGVSLME